MGRRQLGLIVSVAVVLLAAGGPGIAADADWDECAGRDTPTIIEACTRVLDRGNRETAVRRSSALNSRGVAYRQRQDLDRAIRDYDESLRLDPKDASVYSNRGAAYTAKKDYDRAIRDLTEALRLRPNYPTALIHRAAAYGGKDDDARAIRDLDAAIRLAPKNAVALYNRGRAHARNKDYDRAIQDYNEAAKLDPDAPTFNSRGDAHRRKGDDASALRDFDEAIRLDAKYELAYYNRGLVHSRKGDFQRALADYTMAISLKPADSVNFRARAGVREKTGDLAGALQDIAQAVVLDPANDDSRRWQERLKTALAGAAPAAAPAVVAPAVTPAAAPAAKPADPPASTGRRVALVVGNSAYRHAPQLGNPRNDAGDIAAALRRLGFDVVDGQDLDKRGMEEKVRAFARKLDGAEVALFFYAGHGLQVGGKNYLVPVDAKLERAGDLNFDTLDVGFVLAQMEAEPRVNLVFLDACRDNPLSRSLARSLGTRSTSVGSGLASIQSSIGTLIAYATQPENVALDGEGQRNSPFTTALLKHMATPGLEIGVLMRRVRADVVKATNSRQVPWDHSSLLGEVVLAR